MQHQPQQILVGHGSRGLNHARHALFDRHKSLKNRACSKPEGNPAHRARLAGNRSDGNEDENDAQELKNVEARTYPLMRNKDRHRDRSQIGTESAEQR